MHLCLSLLAVLLFGIPQGGTVSGKILDREGKPLAGAQIKYTNIGGYSNWSNEQHPSHPGMTNSGTGKVYKANTNKKGEFLIIRVDIGVYQVEITDASGALLYTAKAYVGDNADATWSNVLNVDLSAPKTGDMVTRNLNTVASQMNRLITDLHAALDGQDWSRATELLQQLLALDPNRWEFYQNLGTIQMNTGKYPEAAQNFKKGVELAEKALAATPDSPQLKTEISGMMMSEGEALNRQDKLDDAMALYGEAAKLAPQPAMAYYHACSAQMNRGTAAAAIEWCNQAIASDPSRPEFYQLLGNAQNAAGKAGDAVQTYEKGAQVAQQELATHPESEHAKNTLGQMLNAEGNLYATQSKYEQAIAAFAESAKVSAYAALPYFNLCATYYNMNRLPEAVDACEHAIASDPTLAEAYYIKAAALFGKGTSQDGTYRAPPETREVLNKYLELAPFGEHARLVREMLDKLDAPLETTHRPGKAVTK